MQFQVTCEILLYTKFLFHNRNSAFWSFKTIYVLKTSSTATKSLKNRSDSEWKVDLPCIPTASLHTKVWTGPRMFVGLIYADKENNSRPNSICTGRWNMPLEQETHRPTAHRGWTWRGASKRREGGGQGKQTITDYNHRSNWRCSYGGRDGNKRRSDNVKQYSTIANCILFKVHL